MSAISIFEIARKCQRGTLDIRLPPLEGYEGAQALHGFIEIPLTGRITARAAELPPIHKDHADRFLIATAMDWQMPIITPDEKIRQYPQAAVIW